MTDEIFARTLVWRDWCLAKGHNDTRGEVNLSGTGETLLHPRAAQYVAELRQRYGSELKIVIPTNGLCLTDELAEALAPSAPILLISTHVPLKAARAVQIAKKHGIYGSAELAPVQTPNDWGGQVEWIKPDYRYPCLWLHMREVFVDSEGRICPCSLDITGESAVAHVTDAPRELKPKPWRICKTCYQEIPREMSHEADS